MAVCDRDCFHCRFEDCICDEMTAEDWREGKTVDIFVRPPTKKQLAAATYQREYREANRESIAAKQREYYEANRESIAAKQREYREANRESIAAKQREYREANREKYNAYMRDYMRRRKEMEEKRTSRGA